MPLKREGWIGISILIITPILFGVLVRLGVLTNVQSALEQIAEIVLASMILGGVALVYRGRTPSTPIGSDSKPVSTFFVSQELNQIELEAGFSPQTLHIGDLVTFNAHVKGILTNAHIGTEIRFRNRIVAGCLDYTTFPRNSNTFSKGKLNGFTDRKFAWNWVIPDFFQAGAYEFHIRVHNYYPLTRRVQFKLKCLLWLKAHLIGSIDLSKLTYPERPPVARKVESVIVNARTGSSV
jgi:hypothetical protein